MTLVLVVDDVPAMAEQYAYDLQRVGGYETTVAHDGNEALDAIGREAVDCVILDLEMPGLDGFGVLKGLQERKIDVPVIVYTGTGNFDRCIQAIRLGAYSFIDKAEPMERVVQEVANALERGRLITEVRVLRQRLAADTALIGTSPAMQQLHDAIARVGAIPSTVLIIGESGSGKELVARDLHGLGAGGNAPFVAINCAALPENLVESELFGHERGAFTGAATMRKGAFEAAGSGTLFLDEIGELPLPMQAKLLRVLEERQLSRVGGNRLVPVQARVVAATNRDLEVEIAAGRFRQDLYFRLNVHVISVPPLREHLSDVPDLVGYFLSTTCERFGVREKRIDAVALKGLMTYEWRKNNVRELRNVVERMIIATDGDVIGYEQVPPDIRGEAPPPAGAEGGTFKELKVEAERQILVRALERNDWQITLTAKALGLADHASLLKIMKKHGLRRKQ
jgi:two-component system nitrogen regulation response regulator NtrX